jgi:methionyl-tRNA synthetase
VIGAYTRILHDPEMIMSDASAPATPAAAPTPAPAAGGLPSGKPEIAFDEFAKVDLRVARIVKAENHPSADRLLKLQLDDGSGTPRQICAGIKGHYTPEELVGRLIIIVANLAPRKIRGEESRGMLLAASDIPKDAAAAVPGTERKVIILRPDSEIAPGSIVS